MPEGAMFCILLKHGFDEEYYFSPFRNGLDWFIQDFQYNHILILWFICSLLKVIFVLNLLGWRFLKMYFLNFEDRAVLFKLKYLVNIYYVYVICKIYRVYICVISFY